MRVLYIMGALYLVALILLWGGRWETLSRRTAVLSSAIFLAAGSLALAAAVYPAGNGYGRTVNRLSDLRANGQRTVPVSGTAVKKNVPENPVVSASVPSSGKHIALTFDDGPYPPYTDRLLDVLKEKGTHVTFFLVAEQACRYPELVRRMAAEGHTVGLHAFRHQDFLKLTDEEKRKDLECGKAILRTITGRNSVYWRPPHGFRDFSVMEAAATHDLTVVNWFVSPRDWTGISSREIYKRVMGRAEDESIVLLHDGDSPAYKASRQATVDAVVSLIDSLQKKGYHLVSLEEYARIKQLP